MKQFQSPADEQPDLRRRFRSLTFVAGTRNFFMLFFLCSLPSVISSPGHAAGGPDVLDQALAAAGLSRASARFDAQAVKTFGGDEFRLPLFDALWADPWGVEKYQKAIQTGALEAAPSLRKTLVFAAAQLLGQNVPGNFPGNAHTAWQEASESSGALARAVAAIHEAAGQPLSGAEQRRLEEAGRPVPHAAQRRAAMLLSAILVARHGRDLALARLEGGADAAAARVFQYREDENLTPAILADMRSLDLAHLLAGAAELAGAVDAARTLPPAGASFSFRWPTPWGEVAVNGSTADTYAAGDYLLILDEGGDDRYHGGAVSSVRSPVSVILDMGGNDIYDGGPGAGTAGYGLLVDVDGDDRYSGDRHGLGDGFFGVGALWDGGGDDTYSMRTHGEGAGTFGLGILVDNAGRDSYDLFQKGQGYGGTRGAGLLVDVSGDDVYRANDTEIAYPSAQSTQHNSSQAQGAGFGRRADLSDGHPMAGGAGVLIDGAGNDRYSAGVFSQGVGYWYGVGLLLDAGGDDTYQGVWYSMGAAAHFAVGLLRDQAGNDRYRAEKNMSLGAGHDFSLGRLDDLEGDDHYEAPNLSLGAGSANGIGVFWDHAGHDTYLAAGDLALGRTDAAVASELRRELLTLGLFLDSGGGSDSYPAARGLAANSSIWIEPIREPMPAARGVGVDQ
ncbi:MAG: hypothetical protein HYX74_02045 [Acidobacteria bacterium]|nr:hypothetical protein [Acidobacteriota bacterium]